MTPTHKFCTQCGKRNNLSAKVCIQCGQAFRLRLTPQGKTCPQCGAVSQMKAKVCKICGYRFEVALPPQPPEPPIVQPTATGIALPPPAEIPPLEELEAEPDPAPSSAKALPQLESFGGKTGILLTPEELERLRHTKPEEKVYIVNRTPRKKNR